MKMIEIRLFDEWKEEECKFNLQGWDFSAINGKWNEPDPPWNYKLIIKSYLKDTDILLDMGTGGGEVLLTFDHPYEKTYATEAYAPNYDLCLNTLSPLGITMAQTLPDDKLPFENETFEFVINRHESFDLHEVHRVLKNGGYFFTQQVSNKNFYQLMALMNDNKEAEYSSRHQNGFYQTSGGRFLLAARKN
jgi:SAM-dependent methyltransferase